MTSLTDALLALDTDNDDLWTADGAPKLDALKEATGEAVTRKQIKAVAPKFSRSNPEIGGEEAPAVVEDDALDTAAIEKEFEEATKALHQAANRVKKAEQAMDKVIIAKTQAQKSVTHSETVKAYQASQAKVREQQAGAQARIAALLKG